MDGLDFDELHRFAAHLAITAGVYLREQALLRAKLSRPSSDAAPQEHYDLELSIKENDADIVTKADKHAEEIISDAIRTRFPAHRIIGEETYSAGQEKRFLLDDSPTWIVDPLDGTVNFFHNFPTCCVSVGFCVGRKSVAGAIFAPLLGGLHPTGGTGTLYSAAKGRGAWSTPIAFPYNEGCLDSAPSAPWQHAVRLPYLAPAPFPRDAPKGCLFTAEWGKARSDAPGSNLTKKVNTFWNMAAEVGGRGGKGGMVHGIRSLGSAALDLVYVATGATDIWWEAGCWEWDVCAGVILVEESGGRVVSSQPSASLGPDEPIPDADLGGRLYLAVRACAATADETASQAQDRVVREIWRRAERLDYTRPT